MKGQWICAKCHRQWDYAVADSCLACHSKIQLDVQLQADLMLALLMTGEEQFIVCKLDKNNQVQMKLYDALDFVTTAEREGKK